MPAASKLYHHTLDALAAGWHQRQAPDLTNKGAPSWVAVGSATAHLNTSKNRSDFTLTGVNSELLPVNSKGC